MGIVQERRQIRLVSALTLLILLLSSHHLLAVNPSTPLSLYAHTAWRLEDGLLSGAPTKLAQTKDGYIWVGTDNGLLRFDGVRFVPFVESPGKPPLPDKIYSLLAASDGTLWIGALGWLGHWDGKKLTRFTDHDGLYLHIVEDRASTVWVGRIKIHDGESPLCRVEGNHLRCMDPAQGFPALPAASLALDGTGALWIGTPGGLFRYRDGSIIQFPRTDGDFRGGNVGVASIAADPNGGLWLGYFHGPQNMGIQHFQDGKYRPLQVPGMTSSDLTGAAVTIDSHGSMWIDPIGGGVLRIVGNRIDRYRTTDGLSGDRVTDWLEDREGNMWVATSRGVDRFRDQPVTNPVEQGQRSQFVLSILANRDRSVWLQTTSGTFVLRNGSVSPLRQDQGFPGTESYAIHQDHLGRVWMGVDDGLFTYVNGRYTPILKPDGTRSGIVWSIVEEKNGTVWILADRSGNLYFVPPSESVLRPAINAPHGSLGIIADQASGLWVLARGELRRVEHRSFSDPLYSIPEKQLHGRNLIVQGPDGTLYLWRPEGLVMVRGSQVRLLPQAQDDPCWKVASWIFDRTGALWISSQCGLTRFQPDEVRLWWGTPSTQQRNHLVLGENEGFTPLMPQSFGSTIAEAPDGRLWFASERGPLTLDPNNLYINQKPPPVYVESISANHHLIPLAVDVRLPIHTHDVQLDYTALSFASPQKVLFRYRLDGYDTSWQDAGTRRQAFYSNLAPGNYTFRVIACNNSGVWNDRGATLSFTIPPAWYQTLWIKILCVLLALGLLWLITLLRLRHAERESATRFQAQMSERMRIARELHDTLLQSLQVLLLNFSGFSQQVRPSLPLVSREMDAALDQSENLLTSGRQRIHDLRAEDQGKEDLTSKFYVFIESLKPEPGQKVITEVLGKSRRVHAIVQDEVLWVMREAALNACKHSGAAEIRLKILHTYRGLQCMVQDDGKGIGKNVSANPKDGHFGMIGMQERAASVGGRFQIHSDMGLGTTVTIFVPRAVAYHRRRSQMQRLLCRMAARSDA